MSTRMTKAEKEAIQLLLAKHQKRHPGCKLSEKRCKSKLSDECIGRGDKSEFHKTAATCKRCMSVINHQQWLVRRLKKNKSVSFKKGTKKE